MVNEFCMLNEIRQKYFLLFYFLLYVHWTHNIDKNYMNNQNVMCTKSVQGFYRHKKHFILYMCVYINIFNNSFSKRIINLLLPIFKISNIRKVMIKNIITNLNWFSLSSIRRCLATSNIFGNQI